jgi:hypothetical protein
MEFSRCSTSSAIVAWSQIRHGVYTVFRQVKSDMQYLLIIRHDDLFTPNEALIQEIFSWITEMERRGVRVYGNPLRPPSEATTIRVRDGKVTLKKGPFSKAKEKICAYELIECATEEEAIQVASLHPMAAAATIEVRPIWNELQVLP